MASARGVIFDIQHFSVHDGPGIRSTVFLKGCPLRCLWCHNPEGQRAGRTVMGSKERCAVCGRCQAVCGCHRVEDGRHRFSAAACTGCGRCVEVCPQGALTLVGRSVTAAEAVDEVLRDRAYFQESGGGVTFSGGEPAYQPEFLLAMLEYAGRQGLHRAVETCGYGPPEVFEALAEKTELFLFDCKETDPVRHRAYTGADSGPILQNLRLLHDRGAAVILRCPIVPGCSDREEHIAALGRLCRSLPGLAGIELLPYHASGTAKAERLGMCQSRFEVPGRERMARWNEMLREAGAKVAARGG